jgi:hypothetical protein
MLKTSTTVAALFVSGFTGLACSSSRVEGSIGDAALASGGQAGGTGGVCIVCIVPVGGTGGQCDASLSCNPGDIPVASDEDCLNHPDSCYVNQQCGQVITCRHGTDTDVDAGGSDGDSGTGGSAGYSHFPTFFPFCNPGDQQVASTIGLTSSETVDLSRNCPVERECYSVSGTAGQILCMLAEGAHCDDLPRCNPGDAQVTSWGYSYTQIALDAIGCPDPGRCYKVSLCSQSILCRTAADAGVPPVVCSGTWSDGIPLEPSAASDAAGDGGPIPCCGDGIVNVDSRERCDLGSLNGMCLDAQLNPVGHPEDMSCQSVTVLCKCPAGTSVLCSTMCTFATIDGP